MGLSGQPALEDEAAAPGAGRGPTAPALGYVRPVVKAEAVASPRVCLPMPQAGRPSKVEEHNILMILKN